MKVNFSLKINISLSTVMLRLDFHQEYPHFASCLYHTLWNLCQNVSRVLALCIRFHIPRLIVVDSRDNMQGRSCSGSVGFHLSIIELFSIEIYLFSCFQVIKTRCKKHAENCSGSSRTLPSQKSPTPPTFVIE